DGFLNRIEIGKPVQSVRRISASTVRYSGSRYTSARGLPKRSNLVNDAMSGLTSRTTRAEPSVIMYAAKSLLPPYPGRDDRMMRSETRKPYRRVSSCGAGSLG